MIATVVTNLICGSVDFHSLICPGATMTDGAGGLNMWPDGCPIAQ